MVFGLGKRKPKEYYPVKFDKKKFPEISRNKKYKDILEKLSPLMKIALKKGAEIDADEAIDKFFAQDESRKNAMAAKLFCKIKSRSIKEFWSDFSSNNIAPGEADYSHVIVLGKLEASNDEKFAFYITNGDGVNKIPCGMDAKPAFTNVDVAVLGEIKITDDKDTKLYLEAAAIYLRKDHVKK